jgi:hypothetical protein
VLPCAATTIDLLTGSSDPEGGNLMVVNLSALSDPGAGTLVNNGDGTVTFTPATGWTGTTTFTYQVQDDGVPPLTSIGSGTVTIQFSDPANAAPVADRDDWDMIWNTTDVIPVLDNDTEPDGNSLTLPVVTAPPASWDVYYYCKRQY